MVHSFTTLNRQPLPDLAVVFLPGWGFDGRILMLAEPQQPWIYPEQQLLPGSLAKDLNTFLTENNIRKVDIIGWSMGAMLAVDFALSHPEKIAGVTLVSMRQSWPEEEIESIRAELNIDPARQLADFYRKCFLGEKKLLKQFRATLGDDYLSSFSLETLNQGLDYLRDFQMPCSLPETIPVRILHGRRDIIAPADEMATLQNADSRIVEGGHLFFLNDSTLLMRPTSKERMRQRFSKAAATYDHHAGIQRDVARRMAGLLDKKVSSGQIKNILEIGCGTGNYSEQLAKTYQKAQLTAVDFAPGMIVAAQAKMSDLTNVELLCEDGEKLLSKLDRKYDLITSNATLQWFTDLDKGLAAIAAGLSSSGFFLASIFGPGTLAELALGLSTVLDQPVIIPARSFPGSKVLRQATERHFSEVVIEEYNFVRQYGSVNELLTSISKTGTSGWQQNVPVLTRQRLRKLDQWFMENHHAVKATYQVFVVQGRPKD
jgi:malonyl-CoA O-methyltransferase